MEWEATEFQQGLSEFVEALVLGGKRMNENENFVKWHPEVDLVSKA